MYNMRFFYFIRIKYVAHVKVYFGDFFSFITKSNIYIYTYIYIYIYLSKSLTLKMKVKNTDDFASTRQTNFRRPAYPLFVNKWRF